MKSLIPRLKALNKLDLKLRTFKKDLVRLPKELEEAQERPRAIRATLERTRAEAIRLKMEADALELEVKSGEEALKRYAGQMNVMRSSKEFEAVRRQMDAQRAWNRENEGKALELLEKLDVTRQEIAKLEAAAIEGDKALAADTERIERTISEINADVKTVTAERAALAHNLPDKELLTYDRIVHSRGEAIARVDRGICSACFMKLPPQVHNLALLAKDLVCCPSCGRILTTGD